MDNQALISKFDIYEPYMDHEKKEYTGQTEKWFKNKNVAIDKQIKKASVCFANMKTRIKSPLYPTYNNLTLAFTKRQFIYWWLVQNRFFKLDRPTIGRIDHSKGYNFDNIRLEEHSYNSKEVRERSGYLVNQGIPIIMSKDGVDIAEFRSATQAAKYTNMTVNMPIKCANGIFKQAKGYNFRWKQLH